VKLLAANFSNAGHGVGEVGDVNGDGFDDVGVGAFLAKPNGKSGSAYVVFGSGAVGGPGAVKLSADGTTASFADVDGDLVTIKTSAGSFVQGDFTLVHSGKVRGSQLQQLDLRGAAHAAFAGANITISAVRGPKSGDGFVNVGALRPSLLPTSCHLPPDLESLEQHRTVWQTLFDNNQQFDCGTLFETLTHRRVVLLL
jgi:hypothetical protein